MRLTDTLIIASCEWTRIEAAEGTDLHDVLKIFTHTGKPCLITDTRNVRIDLPTSRIAVRLKKNYLAKGRKLRVESDVDFIPTGEWIIEEKAESNSYDWEDYVIIKFSVPELTTARKALNWLERRIEELERKDGLTTEDIARSLRS
jgi:hypothetical protein